MLACSSSAFSEMRKEYGAESRCHRKDIASQEVAADEARLDLECFEECQKLFPSPPSLREELSCLTRAKAVPPPSLPAAFQALCCTRSGALPAMEATPTVAHRRTQAGRASPSLGSTPWCLGEVTRWISVLEPSAPLGMGLIGHSCLPPSCQGRMTNAFAL